MGAQRRAPADFSIVGIGASAGGLEACRKLIGALPADSGMAFILVQHLDPTHESMMVDLLAAHTAMIVQQAADGMPIERNHFYIIPPGTYLAVVGGALRLSQPQARHGARLPFDFLLHALALDCGARAICVVLSGSGGDGSLGLIAVKHQGGFVIAQDPDDAGYDGMPRSAIMTGAVDLVLPVSEIPAALIQHDRRFTRPGNETDSTSAQQISSDRTPPVGASERDPSEPGPSTQQTSAHDASAHDGRPHVGSARGASEHDAPEYDAPVDAPSEFGAWGGDQDGDAPTHRAAKNRAPAYHAPKAMPADRLSDIISLLRTKTAHDFTHYKPGTLQRRIERRMTMASIKADDMTRYLDILRGNSAELDLLAQDLLINVTSFFRDPKVFELLAAKIIPELIERHLEDRPLRIWIAGCSTGEETYSLAMLFREAIAASKRNIKLQVFASDVDADAVASAREGLYPRSIEADVSPARLAQFFSRVDHSYLVSPELRAAVVFTVQDVLADPPFSRLDLVSCRNLLIYLGTEAQAKVISLFHFALRQGGVLLLGSSEMIGSLDGRFELISKPERIYRHVGRSRPGELGFIRSGGEPGRLLARAGSGPPPSRQAALSELCRRLVMENYAPAAVLINRKNECLYSLGPVDRYLRVPRGSPTHDLLSMVREDFRTKLRSALQQAVHTNARVIVPGGRMVENGKEVGIGIDVMPASSDGEALLLVCFVEGPHHKPRQAGATDIDDLPRVAELEQELAATRAELQGAIRSLEMSAEEQKQINEEALSVNEEYQSTNEELLTSKEELQSLNEELTALNGQLQETLERQRTTANDLQNVLYSTDVATLFLDVKLHIRFFTPATEAFFHVISTDVGRPLADLNSLANDDTLLSDAETVLRGLLPIEREIDARNGVWYTRRILPYRTQEGDVEGVVITFADITERRRITEQGGAAKRQAELASAAKSRFLAAASHDLRQPLQTLALLQGLLAKLVEGERAQGLVTRLDQTLSAMSGMLNSLLDINQIEAGIVQAEPVTFPVNDLLTRLSDEFTYHANANRLELHVVPCSLLVHSDPHLLEQMIRNLLSNALKYTKRGKVLLGCRRHQGILSIEIWDTGIGIRDEELQAIFEEFHQIDNAARERSRGLGLGLAIVQRLGNLLGHRVRVRSRLGKGSMFAIDVMRPTDGTLPQSQPNWHDAEEPIAAGARHSGTILAIEDDPEVRELLELFLKDEGYRATAVPDGAAALDLVRRGAIRPDLILADYNLPNGMDGLMLTARLRETLHRQLPVIILTGDISTGTLHHIAQHDCVQLNKPVKLKELVRVIQRLLLASPPTIAQRPSHPAGSAADSEQPVIFVVDDDGQVRDAVRAVLVDDGRTVEDFSTCEEFLAAYRPGREACLVIDAYLPGMNGLELLRRLRDEGHRLPAVMITGSSDVPMAVQAMKAGASDFIEKPISRGELLACVERALEQSRDTGKLTAWREAAASLVAHLTPREREIMELVLAGQPSKNIAADLRISQRTVENHRASIMKKTATKSLPALARLALAAVGDDPG